MRRKADFLPYDDAAVADLCGELDSLQARLAEKGPVPHKWGRRLRRELDAETMAAALSMDEALLTADEVRPILCGARPAEVTDEEKALVEGYSDARAAAVRWADDAGFHWRRDAVLGLHARLLNGNWAAGAGEFAAGVRRILDRETGELVYVAPAADQIPGLLDLACDHMERSRVHPAAEAAWIHAATMAILPFKDANVGVAHVLAALALERGGFRRIEFTAHEEWWGRRADRHWSALACLGAKFDPATDVTPFIHAHVRAQRDRAAAVDIRERWERQLWTAAENIVADAGLPARVTEAVWDAFWGREVTAGYYIRLVDVSPATATYDLTAAAAAGLLLPRGERRGRRYGAGIALYDKVAAALHVRADRAEEIDCDSIVTALQLRQAA